MASRQMTASDSDEGHPRTYLVKPFARVVAELDDRITKGRALRAQLEHSALPVPERLEELGSKY